ncbi:GBF-interacting protein 1-like isoform X1 [Zingiber officinale]|uniref:GBF-interacting protein 1-like isoform X1 n=1 Tax=Zingiber officinale TaxID=94328 RepID=UPI001C4AEA71|nr:GBF-interacting protein 1-like isoform X1 [Zingiber officinale]
MSGGGARVSIPAGVRRTIQNIKEIAGNHSDEEIYAMLKECSMDPNETTQKLLLQDTFHEVKRKRDKRKENVREPAEPRWRPGMQGRGGRGGRGNYSSRSLPNDTTAGRNATSGKESGLNQGIDKAQMSISTTPDTENKPALSSSVSGIVNGPSNIEHPVSSQGSNVSGVDGAPSEANSDAVTTKTTNPRLPSKDAKCGSAPGQLQRDMDQFSSNKLVMVPSTDTHTPSELGTTKQIKPHGSVTDEPVEKSQVASSSSGPLGSRPSSTYNNRFQHPSGMQKAPLANKEWKPKSVLANPAQASETNDTSEVPVVIEAVSQPLLTLSLTTPKGVSVNLAKKVEELKLSDRQHVIIPNHLQVPESERHGLSFGSFDANFEFNTVLTKDTTRDNIETPPYESSQETDETIEKHSLSNNATSSAAEEDDFSEHPQLSEQVTESYSVKEIVASNITSPEKEYNEANQEDNLAPESSQNVVLQSMPSYPPVGLVPQLGSHIASFEGSDSHARDMSRLPSFLVQQPYDPSTSYFNPFYRPSPDADGRISPFFASGASTRYNGNIALLPAQAGQASQENTNPIVLPTVGSTPLGTQASGTMQGSLAIPQQSVPVFRQPAGLHISHYSPNYIPYSQYFSPFYPPPPAVHHFLSSAAFPQQPLTGGMYPSPGAATPAAAAAVKYSLPQYKPGSNTGNSTIVGLPNVYGSYNSTQAGYTSVPAVSTGNSTTNEELGSSQFKENNVYISGQQSEGPPVWIPAPGRDMSSLQASSFYNIPQGQHMTFTPTQTGHGAFSGIYPPTPAVPNSVHPLLQQSQTVAGAVEMLAPPTGVYQQTQRAQINWTNNY